MTDHTQLPPFAVQREASKGTFLELCLEQPSWEQQSLHHLICLSAKYAKKYLGQLFHCLNIEDLGCSPPPRFAGFFLWCQWGPLGELSRSDTQVSAWMHGVGLLLPAPVPRLENHAFFPNSDLLAHCQSGHARAASQQKHIGKINLS